jgi:hypothetical protein
MTTWKSTAFATAIAAMLFTAGPSLAAGNYGTEAEASALLDRAIAEMKADPATAIAKFNDPQGGFQDRDLYVFCANLGDGIIIAHANIVGTDLRALKDKNDKPFGAEMLDKATEGTITEIEYMWPRPEGGEPVDKVSRITRLGDRMCGVGYYKD